MSELEAAVDVVQLEKLPDIVKRHHTVKMSILRGLKTYGEITPQKLNDPAGEVGYLLRFFPESTALGQKVVEALNAEGIPCSMRGTNAPPDWHIYSDMFPITFQSGTMASDQPFTNAGNGLTTYVQGACPVADDLFARCVTIPLDQWWAPEDCKVIAEGINKVLSAYCTEDTFGTPWV